ncbi:hypothetical protein [Paraburkholderia tropica]|uniref:hypothetical protein n=1 Tax=Paraburkholderia tropica TaxID=92647 RepID=UPI002AB1DF9A|nr:hypothetical protein [Paraburkholderia tropica]
MGFIDTITQVFFPNCMRALGLGAFVGLVWYLICTHMDWDWKALIGGYVVGGLLCASPQLWQLIQLFRDNFDTLVDLQSQQIGPDTVWSLIKAKLFCYVVGVVIGRLVGGKFS